MEDKRRGSMVVEGSLLLPMTLLVLMALAGVFRFLQLEESLLYHGFEQLQEASGKMSLDPITANLSRFTLEHNIIAETKKEIETGRFLSEQAEPEDSEIEVKIRCSLSVGVSENVGVFSDEVRFVNRVYLGETEPMVWIFPDWGEKYHEEFCYVIGNQKYRVGLDVAKRKGYGPCHICIGENDT